MARDTSVETFVYNPYPLSYSVFTDMHQHFHMVLAHPASFGYAFPLLQDFQLRLCRRVGKEAYAKRIVYKWKRDDCKKQNNRRYAGPG